MEFQVRLVSRTWKFWTQIERLAPRPPTHRCVNILAPRTLTICLSEGCCFRYVWFSYLEEWSPFALLNRKIYGRMPSCLSNIPGHTVWYRKCSSGVPNELRGKKQHSWFSFTNLGVWYNRLRSKWLLFRVKKERLTPEKSLQIGVGCRKPLFHPMNRPEIFFLSLSVSLLYDYDEN